MTNTDNDKVIEVIKEQLNEWDAFDHLSHTEQADSLHCVANDILTMIEARGLAITPKDSGWQWVERDDVSLDWKNGSGGFAVTCGWGDNKKIYLNCAFNARTWETSGIALDYMAIGHVCQPVIASPPIKQGDEGS